MKGTHPTLRQFFRTLVPTIIIASLLCGCGSDRGIYVNYRAIEELRTVQTLGIDHSGGGVAVTAATGKAGTSTAASIIRRSGGSILHAMAQLQNYSEQGQLFFAHARHILLGQAQAESGIQELLDYVERDVNTRMGTLLFVLRDESAGDFLFNIGDGDRAAELFASIQRDAELHGDSHVYDIRSTAVALSEYGAAPVCVLRVAKTEGSASPNAPEYTAVPDGYGILKDGALAGFLSGKDAEAASLLLGHLGTISRSVPDGVGGRVILDMQSTGVDFSPKPDEDGSIPVMEISARVNAVIAELDSPTPQITGDTYLKNLSDTVSAELKQNILNTLALSKALDADFLALAQYMEKRSGGTLPAGWLRNLEFRVSVETVIDHSYDLGDPLSTERGDT